MDGIFLIMSKRKIGNKVPRNIRCKFKYHPILKTGQPISKNQMFVLETAVVHMYLETNIYQLESCCILGIEGMFDSVLNHDKRKLHIRIFQNSIHIKYAYKVHTLGHYRTYQEIRKR